MGKSKAFLKKEKRKKKERRAEIKGGLKRNLGDISLGKMAKRGN